MKTAIKKLSQNPIFSRRVHEFVDKSELVPDFLGKRRRFNDFSNLRPEDLMTLLKQKKITEKDAMFWLGVLTLNAEERAKKHEQLSTLDELTQVYNRRAFVDSFSKELNRLKAKYLQVEKLLEEPMTLALIMIDIDFFKRVNDSYGHVAGDRVLKGVADLVAKEIRSSDGMFRYGGEEFTLLLPDTSTDTAQEIAQRIKETIRKFDFPINKHKSKKIKITVSMGISSVDGHELAKVSAPDVYISKMIERADEALYFSKDSGRDRVTVWTSKLKKESLERKKTNKKSK